MRGAFFAEFVLGFALGRLHIVQKFSSASFQSDKTPG